MADFLKFFRYKDKPPEQGVPDFEPDMPRWKLFFKLYFRKFTQLLGLNALYFIFSIPSFIIAYFFSFYVLNAGFDKYFGFTFQGNAFEMILPRVVLALIMVIVPAAALGPVHAGVIYILRNWGQERHAYIWWDFKDTAKANFKQSIAVTFINLLIVFVFGISITVYTSIMGDAANFVTYAAIGFIAAAFCLFLSMNFYIYPLMVTYDMSLMDIYKSAYAFSFMRFLPNMLVLLGLVALFVVAYGFYTWVGILLTMFILPITLLYIINFYVDPIIKKFENIEE